MEANKSHIITYLSMAVAPTRNGSDEPRIAKRGQNEIRKNHLSSKTKGKGQRLHRLHQAWVRHQIQRPLGYSSFLRQEANWLNQAMRKTALKLVPASPRFLPSTGTTKKSVSRIVGSFPDPHLSEEIHTSFHCIVDHKVEEHPTTAWPVPFCAIMISSHTW